MSEPVNKLTLSILPQAFSICQLPREQEVPVWDFQSSFYNVCKTADELSIVCEEDDVPDGIKKTKGWRAFKVAGPLDFALTGIVAALAKPLAEHNIPVFVISTYDTDYLLVQNKHFEDAQKLLGENFILVQ